VLKGLLVIPACNEAVSLRRFLPAVREVASRLNGYQLGIVVINDGSTDDTAIAVRESGGEVVNNDRNRGLGFSLRRGYRLALDRGCDFAVTMDSDGQHTPALLGAVLDHLAEGADLVTASRYHTDSERFDPPLDRDLLNVAFTAAIHAVTGFHHLTDPLTGFWAMNRRVAAFLSEHLTLERYGTCLEGLIKLWYLCKPTPKLVEVPHPAIYANHDGGCLNREYSPSNQEMRVERFGTHALHVIAALQAVAAAGHGEEVADSIRAWRQMIQDI